MKRAITGPLIGNLPLVALWMIALMAGATGDIIHMGDLEHLSHSLALGLLRIFACSAGTSLVIAWVVAAIARSKYARWIAAFLAFCIICFYVFLRLNYGTRLTPEIVTFISETNHGEAIDYLVTYLYPLLKSPVLPIFILLMLAWAWIDGWWHRKKKDLDSSRLVIKATNLVAGISVVGAACAPMTWSLISSMSDKENSAQGSSFALDAVSNVVYCWQQLHVTDELTNRSVVVVRQALAEPCLMSNDAPTVVLVIGESYIKAHATIYGYPLPTTPDMSRELKDGNLIAFTDVITPYNNTNMSIRHLMSLNSISDGEQWQDLPLFPALFKRAGYQVDIWDNQRELLSGSSFTRGLNGFIYHPDLVSLCYSNVNARNYDYDESLIEDYAKSDANTTQRPRLVIFHLRGQHLRALNRYPHDKTFTRFTSHDYDYRTEPFLDEGMKQKIAHYDNATLYNDHVLSRVFKAFAATDAVVVYLSDHGDEVYDFRPSIGRRSNAEDTVKMVHYQYDTPFVVWCSPAFKEKHEEQFRRICSAANLPMMTDGVGQLLMGLARLETRYYRLSHDALSDEYQPARRLINGQVDYDGLVKPHNQAR
ncbi:MAG: phosphoethanolamine transferase [Muribaculaceae bacterium]|nr:phosphoethanolamine transferase [Muribaculaceae bacterium]